MLKIADLERCSTLNDIAVLLFGKKSYHNREKVKKYLSENGIDWKAWKENKKLAKHRNCLNCGKQLSNKQIKFCSSSCSAIYNNTNRTKKIKFCSNCGKKLSNNRNTFCDEKCHQEKIQKEWVEKWKNGEESGVVGEYGISNRLKKYFLEKYNNKCQCCGWSETNKYTNSIPLEIHHIDGDYNNNREENLQLLCPNCHSLTNTYKNANKKGRRLRKKYN